MNRISKTKSSAAKTLAIAGIVTIAMSGGVSTAFAEDGSINPNAETTLTIHKQASDATTPGSPTGTPGANGTPLKDATFSVTKITNVDLSTTAGWNLIDGITVPGDACDTGDLMLAGDVPAQFGASVSQTTNDNGIASFTLKVAAYLVCETATPAGAIGPAAPFVAALPFYDDSTGDWLYNVNVYPKNVIAGQATKQILTDYAVANPGEITYLISETVPPLQNGQSFKYFIVDEPLDAALTVDNPSDDVVVTLDGTSLTEGDDYVITSTAINLSIGFTNAGLVKLGANPNTVVSVEITANLDTPDTARTIDNTARIYFKVQDSSNPPVTPPVVPGDPEDPENPVDGPGAPSQTVKSYSGNFSFEKTDAKSGKTLKGAEFEVYPAADPFAGTCDDEILTGASAIGTYTSDANGVVTIDNLFIDSRSSVGGLDPENDERCYILKETVAPMGYTTPQGDTALTPIKVGAGATVGAEVENTANAMPDMPLTGGAGQAALIAGGLGALLAGIGLSVLSRRRKAAKATV